MLGTRPREDIALRAALYQWLVWTKHAKPIQVAFPYSNQLWGTAFWFRQLWAESLGKARDRKGNPIHTGQTPVAALGTTDQHSQVQLYIEGPNDKVFTFWTVRKFASQGAIPKRKFGLPAFDALAGQSLARLIDAEQKATRRGTDRDRPAQLRILIGPDRRGASWRFPAVDGVRDPRSLGELLDINAFDQEGVELGKKFTFALMGRKGYDEYRQEFAAYEKKRGV